MTDAIDTLQRFQQNQTTKLTLWNISQVKLLSLQGEDGIKNSVILTSLVEPRAGYKTAAVAESDLNYGLTRMYQAYREDQHRNMPFMTFRTRQEAIEWLRSDAT